jgi:hypothetical protein
MASGSGKASSVNLINRLTGLPRGLRFKSVRCPANCITRALTNDETAEIQKRVDTLHARFQGYARAFRDIPLAALEGQCFEAQETEDQNMVDDLTEQTLDEYVASLL